MKQHLNTVATGAAGFGLIVVGAMAAGLGLSVVLLLALLALAMMGLGLLAAPFVAVVQWVRKTETQGPVS